MADKLAELQRLMLQGYSLVAVDSDQESVVARLRLGHRETIVRLRRADAERLLLGNSLRAYR